MNYSSFFKGSDLETHFHPLHWQDLKNSGLSDETIRDSGVFSVRPCDIREMAGFEKAEIRSALCFPYFGTEFYRLKIFPELLDKNGKKIKYLQKKGSLPRVYFPFSNWELKKNKRHLHDSTFFTFCKEYIASPFFNPKKNSAPDGHERFTLAIVEGEKKTLRVCEKGENAIGIGGIWSWKKDGQLIEDLAEVPWDNINVNLYPDNDVWQRQDLNLAVYELGRELEKRGAKVLIKKF